MPRVNQEPKTPTSFSFTIARSKLSRAARSLTIDKATQSPVDQYVLAHARARHGPDAAPRREYIAALIGDDDPWFAEHPAERLMNAAAAIDGSAEQSQSSESRWMEGVLDPLAFIAPEYNRWTFHNLTERVIDLAAARQPDSEPPMPASAREREIIRILARLGIKADFAGEYAHDQTGCAQDGFCCVDFQPKAEAPTPEHCVPHRQHHFSSARTGVQGHIDDADDRAVSVSETCQRCGLLRLTRSSSASGSRRATYFQPQGDIDIGLTTPDAVIVAGRPGLPATRYCEGDERAAFSALVNDLLPSHKVLTLEKRDVSDLLCQICGVWVGDTKDPDIAHVSTVHEPGDCSTPQPAD